jgi:hypothetical protein
MVGWGWAEGVVEAAEVGAGMEAEGAVGGGVEASATFSCRNLLH